ncbi:MAG: DUF1080 domain-containing protein [Planctomycetaceae bacterium]|nr:DUF1080 domain-containing protein [Planctomycetaceae bacterium]
MDNLRIVRTRQRPALKILILGVAGLLHFPMHVWGQDAPTSTGPLQPATSLSGPAPPSLVQEEGPPRPQAPRSLPDPIVPIRQLDLSTVGGLSEFRNLFSTEGLAGWTVEDGRIEAWQREGNGVRCSGAGAGWLVTDATYSDFILRFEYRLPQNGNSGVAIRCADPKNPTFSGMEIQLLDDDAPKYANLKEAQYTGSLYYKVAPQQKAPLSPANQWNTCEIRCVGDQLEVLVNQEMVNQIALREADLNTIPANQVQTVSSAQSPWKLAERPPLGRIALQGHPGGVEFRNVALRDLRTTAASGLQIITLAHGSGVVAQPRDTVSLHYVGQLADGTQFTNTYKHSEPVTISLTDVIPGWREGIAGMKPGERRKLIVPPELAYGDEGVENLIPPRATLVFEVELRQVQR